MRQPTTSEPRRTCVGCGAKRPQSELHRARRSASGQLDLGFGGRGAWLCSESLIVCCDAAVTRRAFDRAFRSSVSREALDKLRLLLDVVQ